MRCFPPCRCLLQYDPATYIGTQGRFLPAQPREDSKWYLKSGPWITQKGSQKGYLIEDDAHVKDYWLRACTCASRRVLPNVSSIGEWEQVMANGKPLSDARAVYQRMDQLGLPHYADMSLNPIVYATPCGCPKPYTLYVDESKECSCRDDADKELQKECEWRVIEKAISPRCIADRCNEAYRRIFLDVAGSPCERCGHTPSSLRYRSIELQALWKRSGYEFEKQPQQSQQFTVAEDPGPEPRRPPRSCTLSDPAYLAHSRWVCDRHAWWEDWRACRQEIAWPEDKGIPWALMHACCEGKPRGLCSTHDAQGELNMRALFYQFDPAKGLWVKEAEREAAAQSAMKCLRAHGPDCQRVRCINSAKYRHPKPAHRPPEGKIWDETNGTWVTDPSAQPVPPKPRPPSPLSGRPSEEEKRVWLRTFGLFHGCEYRYPEDYRPAYKKAKRPENDSERRVEQRRESYSQRAVNRRGGKAKMANLDES